jgi:hypothetical protein
MRGPSRLRTEGTRFQTSDGHRFRWRGITAFRLVQLVALGRENEVALFLDWAAARKLTVVRSFAMAHHLFRLTPDEGLAALPRLLELAAARGLYVEIVALVDTAEMKVDPAKHVKAVVAIAGGHQNAILEIANEPWHPTQTAALHDPAFLKRLADLAPPAVPVALGSAERDDGYAVGDYVTWHSPRGDGDDGWQHVLDVADGATRLAKWARPAVSDEPIGAGPTVVPERLDDDPARFAAAAALTHLSGLGATFHYEAGLYARIPTGAELACFTAWSSGLEVVGEIPDGGRFLAGAELEKLATIHEARAAFGRELGQDLWIVALDPGDKASVTWKGDWRQHTTRDIPGVRLFHARR